ncbi:hypothetical protein SSCG_02042 [Streptomyces clavuligerus]|nr:hypothetical protein SSCG_02042 [Streptomyces clavuligerus]
MSLHSLSAPYSATKKKRDRPSGELTSPGAAITRGPG